MATNNKILAMHQPNFIPWPVYFYKIHQADIFIILDEVQFPRGKTIANRNKIKTSQGEMEIVVPITKPKGYEGKVTYSMVSVSDKKWYIKALKAIKFNYSKTPYFEKYYSKIEKIFQTENFLKMNIKFIHFINAELGIDTQIYRLSELGGELGQKNELIINLCKMFEVNNYLSGKGAEKYNDEHLLKKNGIRLMYVAFTQPEYPQLYVQFIPELSIIDLIFNLGPASKKILEKE